MDKEAVLAEREAIDAKLDELENFSFDDFGEHFADVDRFTSLIRTFHLGRETRARFASLEQVERLKRALPRILGEYIPQVANYYPESETACNLIERDLPMFITSMVKLSRTRAQQSASGRGAFGRETLEKLREKNAQLEAENAELRRAKEEEPEEAAA